MRGRCRWHAAVSSTLWNCVDGSCLMCESAQRMANQELSPSVGVQGFCWGSFTVTADHCMADLNHSPSRGYPVAMQSKAPMLNHDVA